MAQKETSKDLREARIRIQSVRYEVEASLFTDADSGAYPEGREQEPEVISMNTLGTLSRRENRVEISYEESEETGMDGSRTTVSYGEDEPGLVSMTREGLVSASLVFEGGKRHHCLYRTPYMSFEVCVHTVKVDNLLDEAGRLFLDYIIEIRGAKAERTKFTMELL